MIPLDMNVPASRRDTSKTENLHWLVRNLWIYNRLHKDFYTVIKDIQKELTKVV
jgi:hypothetical protein